LHQGKSQIHDELSNIILYYTANHKQCAMKKNNQHGTVMRYSTVMTPDSNTVEAVLLKQFDRTKQEIESNRSRTTAILTFESEHQTSCRISMSWKYALASLIKAESKQVTPYTLM
jgi:hypothetical protein